MSTPPPPASRSDPEHNQRPGAKPGEHVRAPADGARSPRRPGDERVLAIDATEIDRAAQAPIAEHFLDAQRPVYVFSRSAIRMLDRLAIEEFSIPSLLLMENAARAVADAILDGLEGLHDARALVVSGPGNNGGDGLAVARHLSNAGVEVVVVLVTAGRSMSPDAAINAEIVRRMKIPLIQADGPAIDSAFEQASATLAAASESDKPMPIDVIVDALLGTGVTSDRALEGPFARAIACIEVLRAGGSSVVAVDLPSGMDADTGLPALAAGTEARLPGPCVRADATVTLAGLKQGMTLLAAQEFLGELVIADIGAPAELLARLGMPLNPSGSADPGRDRDE